MIIAWHLLGHRSHSIPLNESVTDASGIGLTPRSYCRGVGIGMCVSSCERAGRQRIAGSNWGVPGEISETRSRITSRWSEIHEF